jgi:hypothetical protein
MLGIAIVAALTCNVVDHGARPNDGRPDTAAFRAAIAACGGRGGRVVVPAGRWDLGQIELGSSMELHLSPGARLVASTDLADFPPVAALDGHRPFVFADNSEGLVISGTGVIDGSGPHYWAAVSRPGYSDRELAADADERRIRFGLILNRCRNARIRDIAIRDTPMFLMALKDCDDVVVDGVTLTAPADSPNTDGLQIIDSNDVRVSNCRISVGDDGIVTKARARVIERLQVTNCSITSDDGAIKFGTRSSSGVRDSQFSNIVITDSRYGVAMFMIHGGVYENNRFSNLRIATGGRHPRHYPIFVDVDDRRGLGRITGLTFDGLDVTTAGNILIGGHPRSPVRDLTVRGLRMRVSGAQDLVATGGKPRGNRSFQPVPGSPDHSRENAHIVLGHVDRARLDAIDISGDARTLLATPGSQDVAVQ